MVHFHLIYVDEVHRPNESGNSICDAGCSKFTSFAPEILADNYCKLDGFSPRKFILTQFTRCAKLNVQYSVGLGVREL